MMKKRSGVLSVGPVSLRGKVRSVFVNEQPQTQNLNTENPNAENFNAADPIETAKENSELTPEMREKLMILGGEIMKQWDLEVTDLELVQGGQMALVWKVNTPEGPVCLKRINRPEKKALFSIHAQNYLAEKGARVPAIIITKDQQLFAKHGPFLFVVYDWIEGRQFDMAVPEDVEWMMKGLAEYHQNSRGYWPPEGVPAASKLGQWPKHYTKRFRQMEAWKLIAEKQPEDPFSAHYLDIADEFIESGKDIQHQLETSHYEEWVEKCKSEPNLCHQDYGTGNTMLVGDEVWIIDLDTTAYDLPIRDLRKIIIPMMSDAGTWQPDLFDRTLSAYESVNPLTADQKKVMYIDMMFPYELYDVVRDKFSLQNESSSVELEEAAAFERLKRENLEEEMEKL
ncbi:MAG TPA: CotS family spore coat protein [Bacillales bacterium]|nr:CotS family spore coat protein [Bacillales bacterium]